MHDDDAIAARIDAGRETALALVEILDRQTRHEQRRRRPLHLTRKKAREIAAYRNRWIVSFAATEALDNEPLFLAARRRVAAEHTATLEQASIVRSIGWHEVLRVRRSIDATG